MLRHELRLAAAAILTVGLAACGDLSHQNPFDPKTPPAQQARATVSGAVSLEAVDAGEPALAGVLVSIPGTGLSAVTDAAGRYAIQGVGPGAWSLQATKDRYRPAVLTGVTVSIDDGNQVLDQPDLFLQAARGDLLGTVALSVEAGGRREDSAAGVAVTLGDRDGAVFSDAAGTYQFTGVPVGQYLVVASKTGFKGQTSLGVATVVDGLVTVFEELLVLPPDPGTLAGSVLVLGAADSFDVTVRARGATLSGTLVELTTTSAANGAWAISPIPAGTYNVSFEKADYAVVSTSATVVPAETTDLANVTLQRDTGSVVGTARLEGAGDHAGIQVTLTPAPTAADPTPSAAAAAITDAAGSWRADLLPVGDYSVSYRKQPGYQDQAGTATVVSHQVTRAPDALLPAIPGIIQGRALLEGAAAAGHAGTLVRLENTTISTFTAADGGYVLSGVGAGAQVVVVTRTGFDEQRVQAVVGPGETITLFDVNLPISRGGLSGRFTLTGAGSSAGVVVTATGAGSASTVTDDAGQFVLTGLPVGTYAISARRDPDWQPAAIGGVTVVPGATQVVPGSPVALAPVTSASIAGTVLAEGASAAGTTVTLTGQDFRGQAVSLSFSTGAAGDWSFAGLAAGSYQVGFARAGFESPAPLGVALSTGQGYATGATTLARSRGAIAGTFTLTGAGSSAGVVVSLQGTAFSTVTDAAGAFTIAGVPVGSYTVLATKPPDWVPASVAGVEVTRDQTTTLPGSPVGLVPVGTSSVSGVTLVEAGPAAGTTVTLSGQDFRGSAVSTSALTSDTGAWSLGSLPAGSYQVTFSRAGWEPAAPIGVALGTGQAFAAGTTTLALSRGALSGAFTLAGAGSSAGVVVTLLGTSFSTVTDATGAFTLSGVPVGTYTVLAAKPPDWAPGSVAGAAVARGVTTTLPTSPVSLQPVSTGAIAGTVTAEGGADAGTTVTLTGQDFRGVAVSRSVTTATSAWSFSGLAAGSYQVAFSRAGWESPAAVGVALSTGQAYAAGATALALSRGSASGVFTLSGAGSSAGVVVTLSGTTFSTVTDAAGAFSLSGVPVGTYTVLAAKPPDWVAATVGGLQVTRDAPATLPGSPVSLQPVAAGSIAGTVTVESGAAAGTTASLTGQDFRGVAVTQSVTTATSAWSFTGLAAGSYQVTFTRAGFESPAPLGVALSTGQAYAAGATALALSRGGVAGTFTLASAASSAGVVVSLSGTTFSTVTDGAGAFTLTGVPVGSYTLVAGKPPDWQGTSIPGVAVTRNTTTTFTGSPLALQPVRTASISGTVGVESGAVAGTTVNLSGQDFRGQPVTATQLTTATGTWTFGALAAGSYQVSFVRAGYESPAPLGVAVGTGQAFAAGATTLALSRGHVTGAFALASAASSAGVVVSLSGTTFSTVTDGAGAFTLTDVPVGSYTLVAAKPPDWQGTSIAGVAVTRGATTTFAGSPATLQPVATAAISGVALAEGLADASGTTASLSGVDFRGVAVTGSTTTAASGAWSFGALRAGSYQVVFSRTGFDAPTPAGVSVVTGQAASLGTVTLAASRGTVAGTVTATGAGAQAGTVVTVSGGPDTASTVTNAAGAWRIDGLRVGSGYQATFSRPAYVTQASATFTVVANGTVPVAAATLALDVTGRISGVALLERPAAGPHTGTLVSLSGFDVNGTAVTSSTTTAADGSYQLTGLPEGTYGLGFSRARYDGQAVGGLFVAAGGQATAASVVLQVAKAVVAGAILLDAGAVPGFPVGTDLSGAVVTLSGTDVPVPSVVTDAAGTYRLVDVPVSLTGATFTVAAGRPFFDGGGVPVVAAANATTTAPTITLSLLHGSLTGTVLLHDNFKNGGDNADHAGTQVDVSGTAFNGAAWTTTVFTDAAGFWDSGPLPPGTYDVTPSSAGRTCEPYKRTVVEPKLVNDQGGIRCFDALAPTAPSLGDPAPSAGADAGYTSAAFVVVPLATQATDPTVPDSNLRGYEVTHGAAPDWAKAVLVEGTPASLTFSGLAANSRNLLWARAVDWLGNAGTATSAEVVTDTTAPPVPTAITPRAIVSDVSTSVTLSGSESDANFSTYEACTATVGPTATCPGAAPVGCTFATTTSNASVALATSQKTCFYARAKDRAGNRSGQVAVAVVSDLVPPTPPTVSPLYDPTLFTVQADYVDFFVTAAATDGPAGVGDWSNVAWVEVDTGAGFEPLCPAASCRPGGVYSPCSATCACSDVRRLCRGTEFAGVRMPLLGGTANRFSIRAVDVAGNVGSGATQLVNTVSTSQLVATTSYDEGRPRTRFGLLTYTGAPVAGTGAFTGRLVVLGEDKRFSPFDTTCDLETPWFGSLYPSAEPISPTAVAFVGGQGQFLKVRRPGGDGAFCTADDAAATATLRDVGASPQAIVAAAGALDATGARERVAWAEGNTSVRSISVVVREPGANRVLEAVGDDVNVVVAGPFADLVTELSLGGNVLLYKRQNGSYTAVTATTGNFAGARTTWALPATVIAAAIDSSGQLMAWVANDPAQTIHLLTAGLDGVFGTADDVERTRTVPGSPQLFSGGVAVEAGHIVVAEGGVASGPASVSHWYDGGDGNFGTLDDQLTRILPSSRGRFSPALAGGVAAGTVYLQVGQTNIGDNADLVAADLSALRWEVASDVALGGPRPNSAGTLFYRTGSGQVLSRSSDGRELRGPTTFAYAASGSQFIAGVGTTLNLYAADTNGLWFSTLAPAPTAIATTLGTYGLVEAGDGYAVVQSSLPVSGALHLLRNTGTPWTATRLDNTVAGVPEFVSSYGMSVSSRHVVWSCRVPGTYPEYACYRSAGPDGILGTADDASGRISEPGGTTPYAPVVALRASGSKVLLVVFRAAAYHIVIVDPGADGLFSTGADNLETDLGPVTEGGGDNYDFRGSMVAWAQTVAGTPGTQVLIHDLRDGTRRQLTTHYSQKPEVRVEASGRVFWSDTLLQAQAIFLSSP